MDDLTNGHTYAIAFPMVTLYSMGPKRGLENPRWNSRSIFEDHRGRWGLESLPLGIYKTHTPWYEVQFSTLHPPCPPMLNSCSLTQLDGQNWQKSIFMIIVDTFWV